MDISGFPAPPSPWPARVARDLGVLLLSILLGSCSWFAGGWLLAGQGSPPPADAPIFSEDEGTPDAGARPERDEIGVGVTPISCRRRSDGVLAAGGPHYPIFVQVPQRELLNPTSVGAMLTVPDGP
jgi:hypothetical protein